MMRSDQKRWGNGQFGTIPTEGQGPETSNGNEKLSVQKKFRITEEDDRRLNMLFYNNKKQWGWGLPSDTMRELLRFAISEYTKKAKDPTAEMLVMQRRYEELEKIQALARRHLDFDREIDQVEQCITTSWRAGDLRAVKEMLDEYLKETRICRDAAIRDRREVEFDKRWGRMYEGLNRNARLPMDG